MKYATWIKVTENKDDYRRKCSDCNFTINSWFAHVYNYCPNCGAKMSKAPYICECYRESVEIYYKNDYRKSQRVVGRCMGTKEREECACGGDESMCDFYPEKRGRMSMSILIKGTEMPKSCDHCWAIDDYSDYPRCLITGDQKGYTFQSDEKRIDSCPLVNVPPHGDLIDRDALISNHTINQYDWSEVIDVEDIRNAPTIIEAEEE